MIKKTVWIVLMIAIFIPAWVFAAWQGPQEVLFGAWGNGIGQFDIDKYRNVYPGDIYVDKDRLIVIPDRANKRIVIYQSDGKLLKTLHRPSELPALDDYGAWPSGFVMYPGGNSFVIDCEYQKSAHGGRGPLKVCFMDYNNNILAKVDIAKVFAIETGYVLHNYNNNTYSIYSPTGQFVKFSAERPLELGKVEIESIGEARYKINVRYPDKEWTIISADRYEPYVRDLNGNLYGNSQVRYSHCGKAMASFVMPESKIITGESPAEGIDPPVTFIEAYGVPVLTPNGDIYTTKQTPDKYIIVKWTWVDEPGGDYGPDAPTGLTVTPSTTGLYLAWKPSLQDPGCVTGYELSRSTSAGGVYSVLTTVDQGVLNYNDTTALEGTSYFYKIRAKSGNDFSPYTPEASGKR